MSEGYTATGAVQICVTKGNGDIQIWLLLKTMSGSVVLLQPWSVLSPGPVLPAKVTWKPGVGVTTCGLVDV